MEKYKAFGTFLQEALALTRIDDQLGALAKEWLATLTGEEYLLEITQSDFYTGMVKMQGEIYDQLMVMDPKFAPAGYGLRDRLPESYEEYLSSAVQPPPVPASQRSS